MHQRKYIITFHARLDMRWSMTESGLMQAETPASRSGFNTRAFAKEYGLGDPVQAAYFTVAAPAGSE